MINLGFRSSGKGLPNVHIPLSVTDYVLLGVSVTILLGIGVLMLIHRDALTGDCYGSAGIALVMTIMLWVSTRLPVRFFNYPVRVNEQNIVRQHFLACRFVRIVSIICNLLFLHLLTGQLGLDWEPQAVKQVAEFVFLGMLVAGFIGYYIMAFRWR